MNNKENQFQTHHFKLQENLKQFDLASLKIDDTNRKFQEEINKLDKELNTASSHHSNSSSLNNKNVFNNVNNVGFCFLILPKKMIEEWPLKKS